MCAGPGAHIEKAGQDRSLWKKVDDEGLAGVFYTKYEHHFIFFRELKPGRLGIISVLHEDMDIPIRLKKAAANAAEQFGAED